MHIRLFIKTQSKQKAKGAEFLMRMRGYRRSSQIIYYNVVQGRRRKISQPNSIHQCYDRFNKLRAIIYNVLPATTPKYGHLKFFIFAMDLILL
jgi:hypothetical protein